MNQKVERNRDTILAGLSTHPDTNAPITEETEPQEQQPPRTVIDVYVIERSQEEEPPAVESTLASSQQESQEPDELETPATTPPARCRSRPPWLVVVLIALCLLMLIGGGVISAFQLFTPSAIITVVTAPQQLTTSSTFHVVNRAADPLQHQLTGRVLSSVTMSQARTVPTTGTAHQEARAAHGLLTLYNAAPYVQTVAAGTLLMGTDGMQIVTDQEAVIPAAVMPSEGHVSVSAHAATTGPAGNIKAGDVYGPCCRLNVFAANGALSGGQNARIYQMVTQQDINGVVTSLKTSLEQSVQAALKTQVQPAETLITPLPCTQKIIPDQRPGEEATQITVTVDETCTGIVYTTQHLSTLATQIARADATKRLGTGYTTTGVQTTITQATPNDHGMIDLQIKSVSLWAYQFGQEQQQAIKTMIAGKNTAQAKTTLLHLAGVQSVSLTLKNGNTVPTDGDHIHLIFLEL